jgi:hypothetical protein
MLNRVLDKRLQNQARDSRLQRFRLHIPPHLQALAEAHLFVLDIPLTNSISSASGTSGNVDDRSTCRNSSPRRRISNQLSPDCTNLMDSGMMGWTTEATSAPRAKHSTYRLQAC